MSVPETVVYEDSPLAEYFASIDALEVHDAVREQPSEVLGAHSIADSEDEDGNSVGSYNGAVWSTVRLRALDGLLDHVTTPPHVRRAGRSRFCESIQHLLVESGLLHEHHSIHLYPRSLPGAPSDHQQRGPSLLDDIVRWLMLTDVGSIVTKTAGVCVGIVGSTMLNRWIAPSTSATVRWLVSCSTGLTLSSGLWMLLRAAANRVQVSTQHRYQSAVTRLISSTQQCDMLIARSLRVIKEYELVRRGFHLSGSSQPRQQLLLPPVTRIEHTEETALEPTCPGLRRSIDDTLETLRQQYLTALVDSTQLDLAPEDTDEEDSQYHSTHSLVSLRESMFALHDIRREYLFHAAMPAISPRSLFLDSLASLSEQLEAIANNTDILSNRLSLRLTSELGVQKDSFLSSINTHSISHALPSHDIVWRHFGNLETTIRSIHIQCRLIVDSLQSDTEFSDIILRYNQLGTEIGALRSQWEAGQQIIAALNDPDHRSAIPSHASSASSHRAETGTGSDQADLGRHDISEQSHPTSILFDFANQAQSDSLDLADSFDLESSAANAASEECHGSRSGLTRAERILIQKAKRAEDSRLRTERQKIDGLVSELKDVLSKRAADSIK